MTRIAGSKTAPAYRHTVSNQATATTQQVAEWAAQGRKFRIKFASLPANYKLFGVIGLMNLIGAKSGYPPLTELGYRLQSLQVGILDPMFAATKKAKRKGGAAFELKQKELIGLACREFFFYSGMLKTRGAGDEFLAEVFSISTARIQKWKQELAEYLGGAPVTQALRQAIEAGRRHQQLQILADDPDYGGLADDEKSELKDLELNFGRGALWQAAVTHRVLRQKKKGKPGETKQVSEKSRNKTAIAVQKAIYRHLA